MVDSINPGNELQTVIAEKTIEEVASNGFKLLDRILRRRPHRVAFDFYMEGIKEEKGLSLEEKTALIWNAKKNVKKISNNAKILNMALEEGADENKILALDEDWSDFYFDKSCYASQKEVQYIWARLLSQESNEPGSVPKALIHSLSIMGRKEAESFMILASYCIKIFSANDAIQFWPIIFLEELKRYGITLESLSSLETVGLLQYGTNIAINIEDGDCIECFDNRIFSEDIQEKSNISIGGVLLSHTGEALMKIISPTIVEGFFENVVEPVFYRKDIKWERIMYNQDPAKQHSKAENE